MSFGNNEKYLQSELSGTLVAGTDDEKKAESAEEEHRPLLPLPLLRLVELSSDPDATSPCAPAHCRQ